MVCAGKWLVAVAILIFVPALAAQSTQPAGVTLVDNPEYGYWAHFPVGANVTYQQSSTLAKVKTDRETTLTLVELTPQHAVVEIKTIDILAKNRIYQPAERMTLPAKTPAETIATQPAEKTGLMSPPKIEKGQEKTELDGRRLACQTQKTTTQIGNNKVVTLVWTCAQVPGGLVKIQTVIEGNYTSTMEMTLTGFKMEAPTVPTTTPAQ